MQEKPELPSVRIIQDGKFHPVQYPIVYQAVSSNVLTVFATILLFIVTTVVLLAWS
jgi:hypothetical protein